MLISLVMSGNSLIWWSDLTWRKPTSEKFKCIFGTSSIDKGADLSFYGEGPNFLRFAEMKITSLSHENWRPIIPIFAFGSQIPSIHFTDMLSKVRRRDNSQMRCNSVNCQCMTTPLNQLPYCSTLSTTTDKYDDRVTITTTTTYWDHSIDIYN